MLTSECGGPGQSEASECVTSGGHIGNGTGFSQSTLFFPHASIITPLLQLHFSPLPQCYIILATDILIHFKMSIS